MHYNKVYTEKCALYKVVKKVVTRKREHDIYKENIQNHGIQNRRKRKKERRKKKVCNMMNKSFTSDVILIQACKINDRNYECEACLQKRNIK